MFEAGCNNKCIENERFIHKSERSYLPPSVENTNRKTEQNNSSAGWKGREINWNRNTILV